MQRSTFVGGLIVAALAAAPAAASAQYTAPPPDPGFHYIFDGTATGSDASFDKWAFAAGTAAPGSGSGRSRRSIAMTDPDQPTPDEPRFETDTVQADRAREQGLGLGERELKAQRDPGGVRTPDEDADADAVDQHHTLEVEADFARSGAGQHVVDGVAHHVGVVQVDLAARGDFDSAIGQLSRGDRQVHGCPLPGVERGPTPNPPREGRAPAWGDHQVWWASSASPRGAALQPRSYNNPLVCKLRHVGAERQSSSYGLNVLERSVRGGNIDVPLIGTEYSRYAIEPTSAWLS